MKKKVLKTIDEIPKGYKQTKLDLIPEDYALTTQLSETRIRRMKGFHRPYYNFYMSHFNQIRSISVIQTNP